MKGGPVFLFYPGGWEGETQQPDLTAVPVQLRTVLCDQNELLGLSAYAPDHCRLTLHEA